jgi:hypothetical protein
LLCPFLRWDYWITGRSRNSQDSCSEDFSAISKKHHVNKAPRNLGLGWGPWD